jgi:iron complex outermembrane receptor protein
MRFLLPLLLCAAASAQTSPAPAGKSSGQAPEQKDSVIVTGVYEPIPLDEADRAVRVIDLDPVQKLLGNTLFDFLRLDPSLDVQSRAPNGVQTDLSIRGGSFGQTLVLLNGVRLNDAQSGHHDLDIPVPPDAVGRIEILKGAGSAIYGSDVLGGTVNVLTRPPESSEIHLRTGIGNFGVNQQSATLSSVWDRMSEQLSFSRDFSTGFMPDRDYRNLSLASITHLRTLLGATDLTLAMNDRPFGANQFYGPYDEWERTRTWFGAIRQELGKNTEASFAFRRHTDLFVLYRDHPEIYTNRHAVEGYQAALRRHNHPAANTTVSYGGEFFRDEIGSTNLGDHQRNYGAVYVAVDVRALKRYSFTLGAREEIFKGGARQFNPTAAFGAWLGPRIKLRASASRAFRLPSYTDLFYHDPANVGNPNLRPESAWGYDAALEFYLGRRLSFDAGVFHQRERDGIDYTRASSADIWRATNITSLNFTGAEMSLTFRPAASQSIDIRYTALHGSQNALNGLESRYAFNYPSQNAVATWQAMLPKGFAARTRIGVLNRVARDPYALWDVYVADQRGRWAPFLQLTNLTDTHYQEVLGIAMPGRAAIVGVDWRLGW